MAQFSIEIPDEYISGVEAAKNAANKNGDDYASAQDYAGFVAAETALRWCEQYKVGPFWTGPVNPEFNADGTPYVTVEGGEIDE
jgi:hypothetical protein